MTDLKLRAAKLPAGVDNERIKVLLITGWGRSGSTVISNVLGGIDGFFSAGEVGLLWLRGVIRGNRCGCTKPVPECELWSSVLSSPRYLDAMNHTTPEDVVEIQRGPAGSKALHSVLDLTNPDPRLERYRQILAGTYRAIAEASGSRVVVDSTKRPVHAAVLRSLDDVDLYMVQLVRDPRGVAYSRRRMKEAFGHHMQRMGSVNSTLRWVHRNYTAELVRKRLPAQRSLLLRYEDFVSHPRGSIFDLVRFVGEEVSSNPFVEDNLVRLPPNHAVSGNQSRFRSGLVEIRADHEWIQKQTLLDRATATGVAFPLLHRYGYPVVIGRPYGTGRLTG